MKVKQMHIAKKSLAMYLWLAFLGVDSIAGETAKIALKSTTVSSQAVFAKVADIVISQEDYDAAFSAATRSKFYHGKPPDGEIAELQREVGDQLVAKVLLFREAKRRGLEPDADEVQKTLQGYEQRYSSSEQWKNNRARLLPNLTRQLERESILKKFEAVVRDVPVPDEQQVKDYYLAHQEKFTEPEQLRVAVILLKMDPSSSEMMWKKAEEEAAGIVKLLRRGEDFAALARTHSGDPSAEQGGDMGYLHNGMLPDPAQAVLDPAKPGEIVSPVRLLEGVAIFRLTDRKVSKLNTLDKVQDRARDLLRRDQAGMEWTLLIAKLKKETTVKVDQSRFMPLLEKRNEQGNGQTKPGGAKTPG